MHKAEPYATAHSRDRGVLLLVRLVEFFQIHVSVVGGESTGGQHRQREPQPADRVSVPCTIAGDRCRRRPDHAVCGRLTRREYFKKIKRNKPIHTADARFVEAIEGDRVLYSPYRQHTSDVKRGNLICEDSSILGAGAAMVDIRDIGVVDGRFFTDQEDRSRAFVAVIGDTVRTTLFPGDASPLNQMVHIEGIEFTVIGVQERLGSSFGRDLDNSVYIPASAFNRMYGPGNGFALFGRPRPGSGLDLEGALDETREWHPA